MKSLVIFFLTIVIIASVLVKDTPAEPNPPKPKAEEVAIHFSGVEIPLNRILLIRKEIHYCALKFTRTWDEVDQERLKQFAHEISMGGIVADSAKEAATKRYASYESYYERDGVPNFIGESVQKQEGVASWLPLKGPFRPFIYQPGKARVECGPWKLVWQYRTGVSFIPSGKYMGDHGFELAPTQWTDIKEVNIKDPRVKWYRYDEKRERVFIPIDKLWGEKR